MGASYAEMAYDELSAVFSLVIEDKIPLIIYSSPAYFTQTNVVSSLLPENVGGFTEFFKGRVVVPFSGSHDRFRRVIKHEMVHVFMFNRLLDSASMRNKFKIAPPPLWFVEGIAEYYSQRTDAPEIDMIVGDFYLSGRPISLYDMYYMAGTYFIYKLGQAFCQFVAAEYGEDKLMLLFDNWLKHESFEELLAATLGESFEEINSKWIYSQKKKYYPKLSHGDIPKFVAEKLTSRGFNVKPTVYTNPSGQTWLIFKANRMGYSGIYGKIMGQPKIYNFIKGERSAEYESLHLLESSISASKDGLLAFISKKNERDRINIYDINRREEVTTIDFKKLIRISSPHWSSDGKFLIFSGITKSGHGDLYMYDYRGEELTQLTDDLYLDISPEFSPDGKKIVFVSERSPQGRYGKPGIYIYDIGTGRITTLMEGDCGYYSPSWSESGDSLIFLGDCEGTTNIRMLTGFGNQQYELRQITDIPTGIFDPIFADSSIIFSAYSEGAFHLYKLTPDNFEQDTSLTFTGTQPYFSSWEPPSLKGELKKGIVEYQTKYSFDIAQSAVGYDAVVGPIGGLQFALTDMLGNHQYYFIISNTANTTREIADNFNVAVTYFNRSRRINWGVGGYRFKYDLYNEYDGEYTEEQLGGVGYVTYPFSRFRRMEFSLYLRQYKKKWLFFEDELEGVVASPYISYIKDTSLWEQTGPIDGMRLNLTFGASYNINTGEPYSRTFLGDFRKYIRISTLSCLATRMLYITSGGKDPQRYYLGGSWTLRGYGFRAFYGKNVFLSSAELRFPLINTLLIGFPIGNFDLRAIRGALFIDGGNAWDDEYDGLHGSFGVGARVNLGAFVVLRLDFAHRTDLKNVSKKTYFDFFFGWNF